MEAVTTPDVHCPVPPAINQHVEQAEQYAIEWARQIGLIGDDDVWGVAAARIGHLASYAFPEASWEVLQIGVAYLDWLMIYDDARVDKRINVAKLTAGKITSFHRRVLDILAGHDDQAPDSDSTEAALYRGILDLRRAIVRICPEWQPEVFLRGFTRYLQSNLWEATNTRNADPPLPPTYMCMRRHTGCLFPTYRLCAALAGIELPPGIWEHVALRQLEVMANNYTCWINDVYSFQREFVDGHVNSLVMSLQRAHEISFQDAVDRAAELCRLEADAYLELKAQLPAFGLADLPEVGRYLRVLEAWMRALYDWHQLTRRYEVAGTDVANDEVASTAPPLATRSLTTL
jgi:hypothetical protein